VSILIDKDKFLRAIGLDPSDLKVIIEKLEVVIDRLNKLVNALKSVSADTFLSTIAEDNIGIARDSTLNQILSMLVTRLDTSLSTLHSDLAKDASVNAIKSLLEAIRRNSTLQATLADTLIALPVDIQYRRKEEFTIFSGTVTASGNSTDINVEHFSAMEVEVKVTAVSGTNPTLQVCIQGKFGTTGDYKDIACTDTITTTGVWFLTINPLIFKTIRARWVVEGTSPSFTFRVDAVVTT